MYMLRICVVDGQGGGIGGAIIRRLREVFEERVEILRKEVDEADV
jgi:hypothetical protein